MDVEANYIGPLPLERGYIMRAKDCGGGGREGLGVHNKGKFLAFDLRD